MSAEARRRGTVNRRVAVLVSAVLLGATLVCTPVMPAFADACDSGRGLQPRVLETDDTGRVEKQYCMGGEWTTYAVYDTTNELLRIDEIVEDPLSLNLNIDARSFFELKNYDPYAILAEFKERLAKGIERATSARLDVASAKVQALLMRQDIDKTRSCTARPVVHSDQDILKGYWRAPQGETSAGSSHITYELDPSLSEHAKVAILAAIDQYHFAVTSQDSALAYPDDIVPREPGDSRPATITFRAGPLPPRGGHDTVAQASAGARDGSGRWTQGWVDVNTRWMNVVTPWVIGHEIGHVMGLDHLPDSDFGTMRPVVYSGSTPRPVWSPESSPLDVRGEAFDACMFTPAVRGE